MEKSCCCFVSDLVVPYFYFNSFCYILFLFQSSNDPFKFSHFILIYNTSLNKKKKIYYYNICHKFNVPKQLKYYLCVRKCYYQNINLVHVKFDIRITFVKQNVYLNLLPFVRYVYLHV